MKRCNRALFAVLAASVWLMCGCGSKANSQAKVAARAAAKSDATVTNREPAKKEDPAWVSEIKLKGIGGTSARRLAIVNGRTLGPGDGIQVKAGAKIVILRCIAINEKSVTVNIEGLGDRELYLN